MSQKRRLDDYPEDNSNRKRSLEQLKQDMQNNRPPKRMSRFGPPTSSSERTSRFGPPKTPSEKAPPSQPSTPPFEKTSRFGPPRTSQPQSDQPNKPSVNNPVSESLLQDQKQSLPDPEVKTDAEIDPLDAFMADLAQTEALSRAKKLNAQLAAAASDEVPKKKKRRLVNERLEAEDTQVSFIENVEAGKIFIAKGNDDDMESIEGIGRLQKQYEEHNKYLTNASIRKTIEYDRFGNIITPERERIIASLKPKDHNRTYYPKVNKFFYNEHVEVFKMSPFQTTELRASLDIKVEGKEVPKPVCSFAHFGFPEKLMKVIRKQRFEQPTPIQCQSIPAVLSGRDVIGLAETGSGKTAAFLWPGIVHVLDQDRPDEKEGPIAVICAPTHELAHQTYTECVRYCRPFNLKTIPLYGGMMMHEQRRELEKGCDFVVCTPGRIIDLVKKKWGSLYWCTYLVFDEADRMFTLGFEPQVRSIFGQCRPSRQVTMFSATMQKRLKLLCKDEMKNPITIKVGRTGAAAKSIQQIVDIVQNNHGKWIWLKAHIQDLMLAGTVLIFVENKLGVEKLSRELMGVNVRNGIIHGGKTQVERTEVLKQFRSGQVRVLVSTDVASRGLDIKGLETVINYDAAHNMDSHTHRVGRTGRAGKLGKAYTLLCRKRENDKKLAPYLLKELKASKQHIPKALVSFAKGISSVGKHITGPWKLQKEKKKAALHSFYKGGFDTRSKKKVKKSFMSTFASGGTL